MNKKYNYVLNAAVTADVTVTTCYYMYTGYKKFKWFKMRINAFHPIRNRYSVYSELHTKSYNQL